MLGGSCPASVQDLKALHCGERLSCKRRKAGSSRPEPMPRKRALPASNISKGDFVRRAERGLSLFLSQSRTRAQKTEHADPRGQTGSMLLQVVMGSRRSRTPWLCEPESMLGTRPRSWRCSAGNPFSAMGIIPISDFCHGICDAGRGNSHIVRPNWRSKNEANNLCQGCSYSGSPKENSKEAALN